MKTPLILLALATSASAAKPILPAPTTENLAKLQARDPLARLEKAEPDNAEVARPTGQSIIRNSTILHDGSNWTLVPNGAVIHMPVALKAKVNVRPIGTLLPWAEFLRLNQGWITTNEVTFDQAAGNEPLPAERAEFWSKQDKIVIAVHQNGPISINVSNHHNLTSR